MTRLVTRLDKTTVLDALFAQWDAIGDVVDGLADDQWQAPTALPGWSVRDVVAHVVGTESMLQGVGTPDADVDVSTLEHVRNDIGVLNERWVRTLRGLPADELLDTYRTITAQRQQTLAAMPDSDWNAITATPAGPDSYGRFMRVRVFDCWMHEHDIRDAMELPAANPAGAPAELALDEMAASMGFVVGKLGRAPDGSRVSIVLTGPLGRTINVAVEGRGAVVDDFGDEEPTATITLDALLFARLAGGRTALAQHADAIVYGGDESVGKRVVEHLNYVI
ncbi:maleylpyruvate isomerase family mycothiol-dependent enzyme [Mycolicibacterium sp. ND9-15]|uniref:maleylpyruvate isomerase family mycothiol-dependent enzyme n=1 Tax=Mycolicibacterium sp. ND9-15 TaxID=3042320 RepID=UPI002DD99492|nr:maleylpyruvate isomerase family mycothiol-dependent enzyme [Mycolicibacterium sp. ND9-15]WSE57236.1 maleylpyruvate isomerase family mycothiol-dependent enzyme [Mycolicibacterium sp. ND9-15]